MKQPYLGLKIIELRQNKGLTQEELVNECNISVRTLQRIESGEVEPRGHTLRLISKALKFDFLNLSQNNADYNLKTSESFEKDSNKIRDILIQRYAVLNNSSFDKIKSKLETNSIEDIIIRHNKVITLLKAILILVGIASIIQFTSLYLEKSISIVLISNIILLIIFQKGLHDNIEIKHILKILKEIG